MSTVWGSAVHAKPRGQVFVVVHELMGERYEESVVLRGVESLQVPFTLTLDVPGLLPTVLDQLLSEGARRVTRMTDLTGKVALVAGATRGAGRGIAAALGEAGATVICTGRSSRTRALVSDYDRPETIEETAELVTALGGTGIAEVVDHLDPEQVAALAGRVRDRFGRLDVLVNDIWGAEDLKGGPPEWDKSIWEVDLDKGLRILRLAIDTHLITSHHLLPLLVAQPGGLLVEMTDGTRDYNDSHYRISVYYDLAKVAVNRLAWSQGHELASRGGTAVALTPGWMRSELMLDGFQTTEDDWRASLGVTSPADFAISESTRFVGRAVAALAADPDRARWNQQSLEGSRLAKEYGFTDVDGSQPDCWGWMAAQEAGQDVVVEDFR